MAFCKNCGAQMSEGAKFCNSCGQAQTQPAAPQQTVPQQAVPQQPPQTQATLPPQQPQQPPQAQATLPPQQPQQTPQTLATLPPQQPPQAQKPAAIINAIRKNPRIMAGIAGVFIIALIIWMTISNMSGLFGKKGNSGFSGFSGGSGDSGAPTGDGAATDGSTETGVATEPISTYEIFGDGDLIKAPKRLQAKASADDDISAVALNGPWKGYRNSVTTEYGFSDDGYFYKNVMITHTHVHSIYHPGYWSYGSYYDTYYYGWTDYQYTYTYTYLDTVIGEYKINGGVIEGSHIFTTGRTIFENDWYKAKTRTLSIEQLKGNAKSSRYEDDISIEFEFINPARIRLRTESEDMDLFWDIENDPHSVPIPKHEIPAVDWPAKALSPDMPVYDTKGRIREASLSYSGDDKDIKSEYKTVTVVADKTVAIPEIDAYGKALGKSGWWVEDYEADGDTTYLSIESRKGMFKLSVSNGRGSGTSDDTVVIESNKYPAGVWPDAWSKATLSPPDGGVIVGEFKPQKSEYNNNYYETVIFDKADGSGVAAYRAKLAGAGFKKPQYSSDDWDLMKYIRVGGDLYLARVELSKRMDSLSAFLYDLSYVEDGVWPESWKSAGLPAPDGFDTIAGAIDKDNWDEQMANFSSDSVYVKYLGLDAKGTGAYWNKLKSAGFQPVKDWDGNDQDELYHFLRIEGRMIRVEVNLMDNEDITEIRYAFDCHEDGAWPALWLAGGLPAPDKYGSIIDAIDVDGWKEDLTGEWGGSSYAYIRYLGMTAADASNYIAKLKSSGFRAEKDWDGDDTDVYYHYLRIGGMMLRVEVEQRNHWELTEFYYRFEYAEDGAWPAVWLAGGLPAPDKYGSIFGPIDLGRWREDLSGGYQDSSYQTVKYLGMAAADVSNYIAKLKSAGFRAEKDWDGNDTDVYYHYLRIDGKLLRVEVEQRDNQELTEFYYRFDYFEDGQWPTLWTSAGIPAPACTAIAGEIDMEVFNESINNWGYTQTIKLLGANLTNYEAALRGSGFTAREYSYSDTWELSKTVQINGKSYEVDIRDNNNREIPEIYISFDEKQ